MIRGVLFDATGTLIELREPVGETYARRARAHGVDLPSWRLDDAFRRIFAQAPPLVFPEAAPDAIPGLEREWWRRVVRSTFLAADSTARFRDFDGFFEDLYRTFSDGGTWAARAGGRQALAALRARGLATGVVSNFDRRLPGLLAELGLAPLLDAIVLPSDAGAAKPDPRIFAVVLDRLRIAPAEALFVGDDEDRDLAGARAAGLRTVDVGDLATLAELPARIDCVAGGIGAGAQE